MENKRGGANRNQGRKPKFDEETISIGFRVPKSKADEIRKEVYKVIDQYKHIGNVLTSDEVHANRSSKYKFIEI